MLNPTLLAICVCITAGVILYLFYFNRLIGHLLGLVCKLALWNTGESSIWVSIGAIHISILAGRISFKNLRYYSANQSIVVVKGKISWRYWIRAPAEEDDLSHARVIGEGIQPKSKPPLSCRVNISIEGLEWLIYNRTAAYEGILAAMESSADTQSRGHESRRPSGDGISSMRKIFSRASTVPDSSVLGPPGSILSSLYRHAPSFIKRLTNWIHAQLPNLDPRDLLPVGLEATTAAITCGNSSTPSLLVTEFSKAHGTYGIVPSRSKHDLYKQVLNLTFKDASMRLIENVSYRGQMSEEGHKMYSAIRHSRHTVVRHLSHLYFPLFQKLWRSLKLWKIAADPFSKPSKPMFPNPTTSWNWRKAAKSTEDATPIGADFSKLEYAKESKILESPKLELLYYTDVVGVVPPQPEPTAALDPQDIGNGDLPPEWGIDLALNGGSIRYGPWADRQRVPLQQTFFPSSYTDVTPHAPLKPGDTRVWTSFKLFLELREGVVLQVPFREASKNWQWDGKVEVPNRPKIREAALIHLKAGDTSTITYLMPMVTHAKGYEPILEIHLDTVSVTTSLNDIRLLQANTCRVRAELPSPLHWKEERQWTFAISLSQPVVYLLRDHINMIADLGRDWTSGPPGDYYRFVPMLYTVEVDLRGYEINTYVNDHNIIDKPLIREENALLTMHGARLIQSLSFPLTKFRPVSTPATFWIEALEVGFRLSLPKWNTHSLYSGPYKATIGRVGTLRIDGSYNYHSEVHPENIDQLVLDLTIRDVIYKACGWTMRHFMIFRDNYFGDFTHFSTLVEYLQKAGKGGPLGDPIDLQYREGASNPIQVQLSVDVDYGVMVSPTGLLGYEKYDMDDTHNLDDIDIGASVVLVLPTLQLQLKTNPYYMDMSLSMDSIFGYVQEHLSERVIVHPTPRISGREDFVIDGVHFIANRLFGPQPHTATYVCIWEIQVSSIKVLLSTLKARILGAAVSALSIGFTDPLNAPAAVFAVPADPDVTFLKFSLGSAHLVWSAPDVAAEIALPQGLRIESNDAAGKSYAKVSSIRLPTVTLKILVVSPSLPDVWYEATQFTADAYLDIYSAPPGWRDKAATQAAFIAAHDSLTRRVAFLYDPTAKLDAGRHAAVNIDTYLPFIRVPAGLQTKDNVPLRTRLPGPRQMHSIHTDSEDEHVNYLLDPDRKFAESPPIPPKSASDEEIESMSSGDESDNDDLTDIESQSEDDSTSLDHNQHSWMSLRTYAPWVAHYSAPALRRPSCWSGSPYMMERDCPVPKMKASPLNVDPVILDSQNLLLGNGAPDVTDSTVIRFLNRCGIWVRFTPLVLPAVRIFAADLLSNQLGPELRIDSLIASHIKSLSSSVSISKSSTTFDIHIHSLQFDLIQSCPEIGQTPSKETGLLMSSQPLSFVALRVDGLKAQGEQLSTQFTSDRSQAFALQIAFDIFSARLCGLSKSTIPINLRHLEPWVSFRHSAFSSIRKRITASLGHCCVQLDHTTPELIARSTLAALQYARPIPGVYKEISDSTTRGTEYLLFNIIHSFRDKPIMDMLSTFQPSYLIQSGKPHKIRTDVAFKFLVHLRLCLQHLESSRRQLLLHPFPDFPRNLTAADIKSVVENQLHQAGLEFESSTCLLQSVFPDIFMDDPATSSPSSIYTIGAFPIDTVRFEFISVQILLDHGRESACTEFLGNQLSLSGSTRRGQWSPPNSSPTKIPSAWPATDDGHNIQQVAIMASFGDVTFLLYPQVMEFVQAIIRVARGFSAVLNDVGETPSEYSHPARPPQLSINAVLSSKTFRIKAAAANLIIDYKAMGVVYTSDTLVNSSKGDRDLCTNQSLMFAELKLQAFSTTQSTRPRESINLALLTLEDGGTSVVYRGHAHSNSLLKAVLRVNAIHLNVPRSAMRLYRFAEEWKADYFPRFEGTMRALLSELATEQKHAVGSQQSGQYDKKPLSVLVHAEVMSLRVSLQVMRGTWLSWEICRIISHFTSPEDSRQSHQSFGLQVGSQSFSIQSRSKRDTPSDIHVKFDLPTFTLTGLWDGRRIHGRALIEFFHFTVKPTHWDTLLSVQQKFGKDFNDFLLLVEETRGRKEDKPRLPKAAVPWEYDIVVRVQGFRVGLEGLTSTMFLECEDITGAISDSDISSNRQLNLFDLALSLAPQSTVSNSKSAFDRNRRSAFVIIDSQVTTRGKEQEKQLDLGIAKIHAVMQPSSIGELGDFIDHLQAEIVIQQEQRASELAEFREKTRNVMRTFDMKIREPKRDSDSAWWDQYNMSVTIRNIGIAFPLALNQDLQLPRSGSIDSTSVRAFLFSTKSVIFGAERGESGKVVVKDFSFQFVSSFRQSVPSDFSGQSHSTRNRLIYPEMTAQLKVERLKESRPIRVGADVDGFILDIDSSISDYIFSLIDVYREGKERVSRLASSLPRPQVESETSPHSQSPPSSEYYGTILTSNVLASMVFASGKVRMYSRLSRPDNARTKSASSVMDSQDAYRLEHDAEVFHLPVVSVWCEYRATPASAKSGSSNNSREPSILLFKSTIHSSRNTLRPTLLPFLSELVGRTEIHLRRSNARGSQTLQSSLQVLPEKPEAMMTPVSSMQISLGLRIDQSKLELTCQPDVNVVGGLNWDSGGFVVNISPGARRVTFTGSVGGLTAGLKHGFLSEDCVKLDARNLAFSMSFAKVDHRSGKSLASVSVVLDTEFSGGVRFSRLQDVLCFKAVWLDRIPLLAGQVNTVPGTLSRSPSDISVPEASKQELVTAVLIRLRSVKLNVDFGQSITSLEMTLTNTIVRTKVSDISSELYISVASFVVVASGNLSGLIQVPDFRFETTRRNENVSHDDGGWMLNLLLTSGPLDIELDSEYHKLLLYRADPLQVMIYDDWSKLIESVPPSDRQVGLNFTVAGTEVLAIMNVGTIPKLVMYANKFKANLEAQREGASRESQAFRTAFSSEPDNPLSAVANAMLSTAKNRIKEAGSGLTCVVEQRMSLKLKFLRLVVFPRSMRDAELAHFIGSDIHARLDRVVKSDLSPASRELHLSFSSIAISRMGQLNHSLVNREETSNSKDWLASLFKGASEATIFGLPSMNMWMRSEETAAGSRVLVYDFSSTFTAKDGSKDPEDIYITLNMSLYSWLTVLRKTFAREMDQIQASSEARNATTASMSSFQRKRATVDPLAQQSLFDPLVEQPKVGLKVAPTLMHSRSYSLGIPARNGSDSLLSSPPNLASSVNNTANPPPSTAAPEELNASSVTATTEEKKRTAIVYKPRKRVIERLTMRQLGEATPDVMHPFFMKKAGFSLEDSLPQYVHEYATAPTEEIMKVLLRLYSRQLKANQTKKME